MRQHETKTFPFEIKSVTDEGLVTGYLSTFGNEDRQKDIVHKGAFTKTLQERKNFAAYWMHEYVDNPAAIPIGGFTGEEDEYGLKWVVQLNMESQRVREDIFPLTKAHIGAVTEASIGFDTVKGVPKTGGGRDLYELRLAEGSLCPANFAANSLARVTGVKTMNRIQTKVQGVIDTINAAMARSELNDLRWKVDGALSSVLYELMEDAAMSAEDKAAAWSAALDEYKTLMVQWFAQMLAIEPAEDAPAQTMNETACYKFIGACFEAKGGGLTINRPLLEQAQKTISALLDTEPGASTQPTTEPQPESKTLDFSGLLNAAKQLNE